MEHQHKYEWQKYEKGNYIWHELVFFIFHSARLYFGDGFHDFWEHYVQFIPGFVLDCVENQQTHFKFYEHIGGSHNNFILYSMLYLCASIESFVIMQQIKKIWVAFTFFILLSVGYVGKCNLFNIFLIRIFCAFVVCCINFFSRLEICEYSCAFLFSSIYRVIYMIFHFHCHVKWMEGNKAVSGKNEMEANINWCGKWVKHLMMFDAQPQKTLSFRLFRQQQLSKHHQSEKYWKFFPHLVWKPKLCRSIHHKKFFLSHSSQPWTCESILASAAKCTSTFTDSIDLS